MPPDTACHTNVECNQKCQDGRWTIAKQANEYIFVCDPKAVDSAQSYLAQCNRAVGVGITVATPSIAITDAACTDIGGKFCNSVEPECVVSGKRSAEKQSRDAWGAACTKAGGGLGPTMLIGGQWTC